MRPNTLRGALGQCLFISTGMNTVIDPIHNTSYRDNGGDNSLLIVNDVNSLNAYRLMFNDRCFSNISRHYVSLALGILYRISVIFCD